MPLWVWGATIEGDSGSRPPRCVGYQAWVRSKLAREGSPRGSTHRRWQEWSGRQYKRSQRRPPRPLVWSWRPLPPNQSALRHDQTFPSRRSAPPNYSSAEPCTVREVAGLNLEHRPLPAASNSSAGSSAMIPSMPADRSSATRSGSLTVQVWTESLRRWARAIRGPSTKV